MSAIPEKLLKLVQPTGLNSKFEYENLSFTDYIRTIKQMLITVNHQRHLGHSDTIIDYNTPCEWRPKQVTKRGALLIHGLFDSPFIMRDIGQHLCDQGFLVRSILLPGHGTIPADLLTTSHKEWYKATQYGVDSFADEVDELFLVGFSTGAALELNYVLKNLPTKTKIIGLIMLCPALELNTKKSISLHLYRMFRWLLWKHNWVFRHDNPDYTKYTSFPVNSGYLVKRLIIDNILLLKKQACDLPIFIVMSEDDETVRVDITLKFFRTTSNPNNRFLLYSNRAPHFTDPRIIVLPSAKLDENILSLSHIAIPNSPENRHYGRHGDYQELLIEPKNSNSTQPIYLGAATSENEAKYRFRRITFNPFFKELMQSIDAFIQQVKSN